MASVDAGFNSNIFRFQPPWVIAANRNSAQILGARIKYQAGGYAAGTILARNSTDGLYQAYASGGSSGTNVAVGIMYEGHAAEDFDGTSSATSTTVCSMIVGGCSVFKDNLTGYAAGALTDLKGRLIVDAAGTNLLVF